MTDYERLKNIIDEIDNLIQNKISYSDSRFDLWKSRTERFLLKKYRRTSFEYKEFINSSFLDRLYFHYDPNDDLDRLYYDFLNITKGLFTDYLEDMKENPLEKQTPIVAKSYSKIFIVHGHDGELKESVARIVEKQNIEAIILSEQANLGRTIVEKFEDYSDVDGAICLFTADDYGRSKIVSKDNFRARQNVVLETGYFMGKLGRKNIVILADNDIEMPSDLSGVVYTNTTNWQINLLKELKEIGYKVDLNKLV